MSLSLDHPLAQGVAMTPHCNWSDCVAPAVFRHTHVDAGRVQWTANYCAHCARYDADEAERAGYSLIVEGVDTAAHRRADLRQVTGLTYLERHEGSE